MSSISGAIAFNVNRPNISQVYIQVVVGRLDAFAGGAFMVADRTRFFDGAVDASSGT